MSKKTPMDKWCEKNGYDKDGVFVCVSKVHEHLRLGDKLMLEEDENDDRPLFKLISTGDEYEVYAELSGITQEKTKEEKETTFPTTPFKLKCGDKPEVRQWLKDNGCDWINGYCIVSSDHEKDTCMLFIIDGEVSHQFDDEQYYNNHKYPEVNPIITPAKVVGYTTETKEDNTKEKEKIKRKIAKLQKKLEGLG